MDCEITDVIIVVVVEGSDEEMDKLAEEEEEEALALQKHMDATFEEQDFDAADFEVCLTVLITLSLVHESRGLYENIQTSAFYLP